MDMLETGILITTVRIVSIRTEGNITMGSQKVPGIVVLHCRTNGDAYLITFKVGPLRTREHTHTHTHTHN
jgi:hypothetical protein